MELSWLAHDFTSLPLILCGPGLFFFFYKAKGLLHLLLFNNSVLDIMQFAPKSLSFISEVRLIKSQVEFIKSIG